MTLFAIEYENSSRSSWVLHMVTFECADADCEAMAQVIWDRISWYGKGGWDRITFKKLLKIEPNGITELGWSPV